jgi:hypothetical protein
LGCVAVIAERTADAVARNVDAPNSSDASMPIYVASEAGSDAQRSACTRDVLRLDSSQMSMGSSLA